MNQLLANLRISRKLALIGLMAALLVAVPMTLYVKASVQAMQGTVATNASLTLRFVAGVTPAAAWRVVPQISRLDARALSERDVQLQLGDLQQGEGQAVLVELVVLPKGEGVYRIAQAEVGYDLPALGLTGQRVRQDVMLSLCENPAGVGPLDPDTRTLN